MNKEKYPKDLPDGRTVVIGPEELARMSSGRREWFNPDGTAKSVSEIEGKSKVGPDDGDLLG